MRVLLVEDDFDLGEMYGLALKKAGHGVFWVRSAQEALDALDKEQVEVIVLDMMLPVNNGLNVLHELRSYEDWRQIPVVILSSLKPDEIGATAKHLKSLGVYKYLVKSETKPEALCEEIEHIEQILNPK